MFFSFLSTHLELRPYFLSEGLMASATYSMMVLKQKFISLIMPFFLYFKSIVLLLGVLDSNLSVRIASPE
jgi:hypothetical protein